MDDTEECMRPKRFTTDLLDPLEIEAARSHSTKDISAHLNLQNSKQTIFFSEQSGMKSQSELTRPNEEPVTNIAH